MGHPRGHRERQGSREELVEASPAPRGLALLRCVGHPRPPTTDPPGAVLAREARALIFSWPPRLEEAFQREK
eukprot:11349680-Alexandrium_andersonii.AAC.1